MQRGRGAETWKFNVDVSSRHLGLQRGSRAVQTDSANCGSVVICCRSCSGSMINAQQLETVPVKFQGKWPKLTTGVTVACRSAGKLRVPHGMLECDGTWKLSVQCQSALAVTLRAAGVHR